jgi:hypothetical protein
VRLLDFYITALDASGRMFYLSGANAGWLAYTSAQRPSVHDMALTNDTTH